MECLKNQGVHLVIHYDPVVTNDPELNRMRQLVAAILQVKDPRLTIHDFRMVSGENRTNLVFDVVIPAEEIMPENFDSAEALWALICRLDED